LSRRSAPPTRQVVASNQARIVNMARLTVVIFAAVITSSYANEPAYTAPGQLHTGARASVRKLSAESLQMAVTKHRRFVVLMHDGVDSATRAFQPWLYAIANMMPHLPIGTIDLSHGRGSEVASAFEVDSSKGAPTVKLFVRDNPKGKRIIDYHGPLEFDAMLGWMKAAVNEEEHEHSAYGVEPEGSDEVDRPSPGAAQGSPMSRLPESVRAMAQTMVRETRLQRILKQHGGGKVEQYDAMVAAKYREIIESKGTDMGDKFAVQEANRLARDAVREQLMADAPLHIREEVEADVNLGDAANNVGSGSSSGSAAAAASGKKKPKKTGPKQEL